MKPWQLNRKVEGLSTKIDSPVQTETRFDINCFSEPERHLLNKIQEITEVRTGNAALRCHRKECDLWYKGLEIFGRRATDLFFEVVPDSLCYDELEKWYFKLYFHNFWLDWMERIKEVRKMPKEQRDKLLCERREMGLLDKVFRLKRYSLRRFISESCEQIVPSRK